MREYLPKPIQPRFTVVISEFIVNISRKPVAARVLKALHMPLPDLNGKENKHEWMKNKKHEWIKINMNE